MMWYKEKLISIIGKDKYISVKELDKMREELGKNVADKIYDIAGKGHRLSISEMAEVLRLYGKEVEKKTEEKFEKKLKELNEDIDIEQNKKILEIQQHVNRLATGNYSYLGDKVHSIEKLQRQFEKDLSGLAKRIMELENKIRGEE